MAWPDEGSQRHNNLSNVAVHKQSDGTASASADIVQLSVAHGRVKEDRTWKVDRWVAIADRLLDKPVD